MRIKICLHYLFITLGLLACVDRAAAQGTTFTYQGRLETNSVPANGFYDFEFALYNNAGGTGSPLGTGTITQTALGVTNGLFTTTLNFGAVFTGSSTWLAISARSNGVGSYTPLTPLQQLNPTPYAITAENLDGTLPATQLTGTVPSSLLSGDTFSGNGSGLTSVNALTLGGFGAAAFWQLTGNAGTAPGANYLGTPDDEAFEIKVNNARAMLIQPDTSFSSANITLGHGSNFITAGTYGDVIGGGGYTYANANQILSGYFDVISGGIGNTISNAYDAMIPGGYGNTVTGNYGFAAGDSAQALNSGSFVWADGTGIGLTDTAANQFQILASGGVWIHDGTSGVYVDASGNGAGSINYGIRFGQPTSGEGIASNRTTDTNQYGLDLYTDFNRRISITQHGNVGIGTTSPTEALEVNGDYVMIDGAGADNGVGAIDAYIGGNGSGSDVQVGSFNSGIDNVAFYNWGSGAYMHIFCSAITITGGSDLAEPFDVSSQNGEIPQGSVVVIDSEHPGRLKVSGQPYDTRVAGVLSGANGIHPGIQMQQEGLLEGGKNVALTGRVYVLADASNGAINPGDLLTTSATPGHAMKVSDHARASGAILGKAMSGLQEGKGMVLVLVTLQ